VNSNMVIRKVFIHGKSHTITLPREWEVPEVLNVYANSTYFIYSPAKGLESVFKAELVTNVRRRTARTGGDKYIYYLLTIPRSIVLKLGIKPGSQLFILRTSVFNIPTFICVTRWDIYERMTLKLVRGDLDFSSLLL